MKILQLTRLTDEYIPILLEKNPDFYQKNYNQKEDIILKDFVYWGDGWIKGLQSAGFEAYHVIANDFMQYQWAKEHDLKLKNASEILTLHIQEIHPDVVFFCFFWTDVNLIQYIKEKNPYVKYFIFWVGSGINESHFPVFKEMNMIFSCAPEAVEYLTKIGMKARHINHAFNPSINSFLCQIRKKRGTLFSGRITYTDTHHIQRANFLLSLMRNPGISIYTSVEQTRLIEEVLNIFFRRCVYFCAIKCAKIIPNVDLIFRKLPYIRKAILWDAPPDYPLMASFLGRIKSPLWGLDMFQALSNALVVFNMHADSSPRFASNMRLFEATGVGSCLVTDWKKNISEFFDPDYEIVTYNSKDECIEKIRWLNEHPQKAIEIGQAAKKRCLREHTCFQQGWQIREAICKYN